MYELRHTSNFVLAVKFPSLKCARRESFDGPSFIIRTKNRPLSFIAAPTPFVSMISPILCNNRNSLVKCEDRFEWNARNEILIWCSRTVLTWRAAAWTEIQNACRKKCAIEAPGHTLSISFAYVYSIWLHYGLKNTCFRCKSSGSNEHSCLHAHLRMQKHVLSQLRTPSSIFVHVEQQLRKKKGKFISKYTLLTFRSLLFIYFA